MPTARKTAKKTAVRKAAKKTVARKTAAKKAANAKGMSVHIGLNGVDPRHYAGWGGQLFACEQDAKDMAAIATSRGIAPTLLLTGDASRAAVLKAIRAASRRLTAGDFFLLTYSGHGGQVPDIDHDEADHRDETWCFYDGQFIDDELYLELSKFAKGVRIFVLSDSCHSGTVCRAALTESAIDTMTAGQARPKWMPRDIADKTYAEHRAFYDNLQRAAARAGRGRLVEPDAALAQVRVGDRVGVAVKSFAPAVILISGCQDNQTSMDGDHNGAFTERLLAVWNRGTFTGNYARFHATIKAGMLPTQTPNLFSLGSATPFLAEHPFDVAARR
jgi:metacaspase-1